MLLPSTPQFRKHRGHGTRGASLPPAPPVVLLNVVEVVAMGDPPEPAGCQWHFDGDVTLTGIPSGFLVLIGGVWCNPISAYQAGSDAFVVYYDTLETLDTKEYAIHTTPAGIAQAAQVALPQNGIIGAP